MPDSVVGAWQCPYTVLMCVSPKIVFRSCVHPPMVALREQSLLYAGFQGFNPRRRTKVCVAANYIHRGFFNKVLFKRCNIFGQLMLFNPNTQLLPKLNPRTIALQFLNTAFRQIYKKGHNSLNLKNVYRKARLLLLQYH